MTYPEDRYSTTEAEAAAYEAAYNEPNRLLDAEENGYDPRGDY